MPFARPFAERFLPEGAVADAARRRRRLHRHPHHPVDHHVGNIARRVKRSSLSALDRTLGLIFGLVRGVLLVAIGSVALFYVLPQGGRPAAAGSAKSRTLPLIQSATDSVAQLLPSSLRKKAAAFNPGGKARQRLPERAARLYRAGAAIPAPAAPASRPQDQQRLNQLIQQIGSTPETPRKTGPMTAPRDPVWRGAADRV